MNTEKPQYYKSEGLIKTSKKKEEGIDAQWFFKRVKPRLTVVQKVWLLGKGEVLGTSSILVTLMNYRAFQSVTSAILTFYMS